MADTAMPLAAGVRALGTLMAFALAAAAPVRAAEELQPVEITGQAPPPYQVRDASSGTRTDTPVLETPMSVQVVPQQLLRDQRVHSINEAVRNVSGITRGAQYGVGDSFTIRGFAHGDATYEDGAKLSNGAALALPRSLANIEQVEVIKGPASLLYGQGEPGGLVNNVTKKPLEHDYFAFEQEIGSFQRRATQLDLSGPLALQDSLLYRLNVAAETEKSFRDFVATRRFDIYPTLQLKLGEATQFTTQLHYGKGFGYIGDSGIPLIDGRRAEVPISRNLSEPDLQRNHVEERSAKIGASHEFGDSWKLRGFAKVESITACKGGCNQAFIYSGPDANGDVQRAWASLFYNGTTTVNASLDLTGRFQALGARHTLLAGADFYRLNEFFAGDFSAEFDPDTGDLVSLHFPPINLYHPVYGQPRDPRYTGNDFMVDHTARARGVFVQDQIELPQHLFALIGFRHDRAVDRGNLDPSNPDNPYPAFDYPTYRDKPSLSHRYGLLWHPAPEWSVYGSYTENFGASAFGQIQFGGGRSPGETAQQYELGFKAELLDKRLTASMAVYQLTKQNVLATDPVHGSPYVIPLGEVRDRGIEFDVSGEVLPRWDVVLTGSYIDARTTQAEPAELLGRTQGVPRLSGSVWNSFAFEGALAGLRVGGGVEASGSQLDYFKNRLPGYATTSLFASYGWRAGNCKLTAQLNVTNLFDKDYYASPDNIPGKPRSAVATLRVEY